MARATDAVGALERRRQDLQRLSDAAGGLYTVSAKFEVTAAGEGTFPVEFACRFVEEPVASITHHMATGQRLIPGNFPKITHGVYVWHMALRQPTGLPFYTGATVYWSATGPSNLHFVVHASFQGNAIRNEAGVTS